MSDYYGIDLDAVARWQHGNTAKAALDYDHAYGWKAVIPSGEKRSLDLQGYYNTKHPGYIVIHTSLKPSGWAVTNPKDSANDYLIQPVVIISDDQTWNVATVQHGIDTYRRNWETIQRWTKGKLGRTIRLASQTQLVIRPETSQQLLDLARSTSNDGNRFDLFLRLKDWTQQRYSVTNPRIIYACALYTGNHPEEDYGAAANQNWVALSSCNTSWQIDDQKWDPKSSRVAYGMAHELFHCFDLPHPDASHGEGWQQSLMYWGQPPGAGFTTKELVTIGKTRYLS